MIKSFDPDAWNAIVRQEAQRRIKNFSLDRSKLTPDNAPAKLRSALFGEGNKRQIFLDALDPKQRQNALFLEKALERAALGRPGGSQTGVREVITEKIKGAGLAFRRFLKNPVERLIATGEESAFNRNSKVMGEMIFDTKWSPRIRRIKKMTPGSNAEMKATLQLLDDIAQESGNE